VTPNPSIERTATGKPLGAAHVERQVLALSHDRFNNQEGHLVTFDEFRVFWHEYTAALMARDIDQVLACYTDDVVYDESPMMMSTPRSGKKQCQDYWSKVFEAFSSISISTTSIAFNNDQAWVEWTMSNFHAPTQTDLEIHGALVVTMRDGKLAHERLFWDRSKLERDLGAWGILARMGIALNILFKRLRLQRTGGGKQRVTRA